jgi:catechol 2,3-dioxygenase-like lactoylglutathione lyase family enzyme
VPLSPLANALDEAAASSRDGLHRRSVNRGLQFLAMRFRRVQLQAPSGLLDRLSDFYVGRLGLDAAVGQEAGATIGETQLVFSGASGEPFYHFALLVPGNRFNAALDWIRQRAELLPDPDTGDPVFDFDNWDALACYFHDPAGNIVELIAHRGIDESEREGPFAAAELVGISELGLVGDKHELATALREIGVEQWDGAIKEAGRLAFVGEKARTIILSPAGRGWLPTGRPAEAHPAEVELSDVSEGGALLAGGRYRIRGRP